MAYFATTRVCWGQPAPDCAHVAVERPETAADIVRSGGCAWLPDENAARETLRLLGNDEQNIERRMHFAKTGRLLSEVTG